MRTLIALLFAAQAAFAQLNIEEPIRYLALGDSYTIGESVDYYERWSRVLYDSLHSLGYETDTIDFIARTGWRTDNLQNAINGSSLDSNYNMVSLLIGVNNIYQFSPIEFYKNELPELLNTAIAYAEGLKDRVFVVSIPDYMFTPFGSGYQEPEIISNEIDAFNGFAEYVCDSLGIKFYNITDISREGFDRPELVARDGLHPSGIQYQEWVERILSNTITNVSGQVQTTSIYPNPSKDIINLTESDAWSLINNSGNVVSEGKGSQVNVSELPEGIYILKTSKTTQKISVQ